MGWYVKVMRADGGELGTRESVQERIAAHFAGTVFTEEPAGPQKVADLEKRNGFELPEALRSLFAKMPVTYVGDFGRERDSLWIHFHLGSRDSLRMLTAEIKGDLDTAEQMLGRLCAANEWVLSEYSPADENG